MHSHGARRSFPATFFSAFSPLFLTTRLFFRQVLILSMIVAVIFSPAAGYCFDFSGTTATRTQNRLATSFTPVQATTAAAAATRPNCAANALSHILQGVSPEMLQQELKGYTAGRQTTMLGMQQVAMINGTDMRGAAFSYDDLRQAQGAVIAHMDLGEDRGHYVDVLKATAYAVTYIDNQSVTTVSRDEFESLWTGAVLTEDTQRGRDLTATEMQEISGGWDIVGAIGGAVSGIASAVTSTAGAVVSAVQTGISAAASTVHSIGAGLSSMASSGAGNAASNTCGNTVGASQGNTSGSLPGIGGILTKSTVSLSNSTGGSNSSGSGVPFAYTPSNGSLLKDLISATTVSVQPAAASKQPVTTSASGSGAYVDQQGRTVQVTTDGLSYEARDSRGMIVASGSCGSWGNEIYSQSLEPMVTAPAGVSGAPEAGQRPEVQAPTSVIDLDRQDAAKINASQLADGQIVRLPGNALLKDQYFQWDAAKNEFYEVPRPEGVEPSRNVSTAGINLPEFNGLSGLSKNNRTETGVNNVITRTEVVKVKETVIDGDGGDLYQDPDGNIVSVSRNGSAYEVRDSRGSIISSGSGGSWRQDPYSAALVPVQRTKAALSKEMLDEKTMNESMAVCSAAMSKGQLEQMALTRDDSSGFLEKLSELFMPSPQQAVSRLLAKVEGAGTIDAKKDAATDITHLYRSADDPGDQAVINNALLNSDAGLINERNQAIWEKHGVIVLEFQRQLTPEEAATIDSTLSALPQDKMPEVISLEAESAIQDRIGEYQADSRAIVIFANVAPGGAYWTEDQYRRTLVHEIAHYNDFARRSEPFSLKLDGAISYASDPKVYNYAEAYGQKNKLEDYATMQEAYFEDSESVFSRGVGNMLEYEDDTFLSKVSNVASSYQHTRQLSDGQTVKCTYTYAIDPETGDVTRSEVALKDMIIEGESFLLPDFGQTYETIRLV